MRLILIFVLKIEAEKLKFDCLKGDIDKSCEVNQLLKLQNWIVTLSPCVALERGNLDFTYRIF